MNTASQRSQFRLADHVRACRIDDQVVLLDLRRSKYLGVGGPQLSALADTIIDWPAGKTDQTGGEVGNPLQRSTTESWIIKLRDQRMLAEPRESSRSFTHLDEPLQTIETDTVGNPPAVSWRNLMHLAAAASVASYWMRFSSLAGIADSVTCLRRSMLSVDPVASSTFAAHVASYVRLRPFVITAQDQCLRDSLTLVCFLAKKGIYPTWVIGVKTRPFGAHSWVQSGNVVLNDSHEYVRAFRPILVV